MKNQRPATGPGRAFWSILDPPRYRERFVFALAISVYVHGLILLLEFGAAGFGVPWAERRAQGPDLTLRLEYALRPPASAPTSAPVPLAAATPSRADSSLEVRLSRAVDAEPPQAPLSLPRRETRAPAPAAKARARDRKIQAKPQPQILALSAPQEETFKVPPPKLAEPEPQRAPQSAAKKQIEEPPPAVQPTEQVARRQTEEELEAKKQEEARRLEEARKQEEARRLAEAKKQEEARRLEDAKKQEEARLAEAKKQEEARRLEEAKKQDEARRLALELETRRRAEEIARQEAEELARQRALALQKEQEAKKLQEARRLEETRKLEEARIQDEMKKQEEARRLTLEAEALRRAEDAARQQAEARRKELEARRQAEEAAARAREIAERQRLEGEAAAQRERLAGEQARTPAPGAPPGRELAAKALDQLRTPGAARDELLRTPSPPASDSLRRRALVGPERDVPLRMYVESWRWKIERNGALNYRPSAGWRASDNPIVTVSIRSDGSLEGVSIHRSSGLRELDEAALRIARLHAPYSAFPPALARQYDVLEIRRVWSFDGTLKILEEM